MVCFNESIIKERHPGGPGAVSAGEADLSQPAAQGTREGLQRISLHPCPGGAAETAREGEITAHAIIPRPQSLQYRRLIQGAD